MKNLIILAHPDIKNSVINKRFLKEAAAQSFEELIAFSSLRSRTKAPQNIRFLALCSGMRCEQSGTASASKTARQGAGKF